MLKYPTKKEALQKSSEKLWYVKFKKNLINRFNSLKKRLKKTENALLFFQGKSLADLHLTSLSASV